jgi:hypothetical protein
MIFSAQLAGISELPIANRSARLRRCQPLTSKRETGLQRRKLDRLFSEAAAISSIKSPKRFRASIMK